MSQFDQIVGNLTQTRSRLQSRLRSEEEKRDGVNDSLKQLQERQRLYHRLVEKFRKECNRHELLSQQKQKENIVNHVA